MGLSSIDFNQIDNIDNTPTGLNINKSINFTQQFNISDTSFQQNNTSNIWIDKNTGNFNFRINNVSYKLKPKDTLNNISISNSHTIFLGGKRGIINNLTVTGANTVLTVRTGSTDWSILEVQGDLTIDSGCALNLIRTPLIVRGSILGSGVITSPHGVNGGVGGNGGPGGISTNSSVGGTAPILGSPEWTDGLGQNGSLTEIEYNISSGRGGNGGRGTAAGGANGAGSYDSFISNRFAYPGFASGNGFAGGQSNPPSQTGAGGGSGGAANGVIAGPGSFATPGTDGLAAGNIGNILYIGLGNSSPLTPKGEGQFGGQGSPGGEMILTQNYPSFAGSLGGRGGNGGSGGSTGGAHLTVFCIGDISSNITFRPGKGGINGGVLTEYKAATGSLWLFNKYGTSTSPGNYDISGVGPVPNGPNGSVTRILTSDTTSVNSFFRNILYNSNGLTPAKEIIAISI